MLMALPLPTPTALLVAILHALYVFNVAPIQTSLAQSQTGLRKLS